MANNITKTTLKVKVMIDGKFVDRTIYNVDGKKCIIRIVNNKRTYVPLGKFNKPTKKQSGGGGSGAYLMDKEDAFARAEEFRKCDAEKNACYESVTKRY